MRFNRLDLNLLVALDALLTEHSTTRAARRLNLSQSAMSGALARLRKYFSDPLFVPAGRRLVPTPLAESLVGPTRDVLLQIQATIITKPGFDPKSARRHFTIIATDYFTAVFLPGLAARVHRMAPGITMEVLPFGGDLHARLDRGEVDFLVVPDRYKVEGHPSEVLFTDRYTCIAWKGSRSVGKRLSLEHYLALGHVVTRFGISHRATLDEVMLQRAGHQRRIEVVTNNFISVPYLVVGTNRIATVHLRLARQAVASLPIRIVSPPLAFPPVMETVQWHRHAESDPGHQWLRSQLRAIAGVGRHRHLGLNDRNRRS